MSTRRASYHGRFVKGGLSHRFAERAYERYLASVTYLHVILSFDEQRPVAADKEHKKYPKYEQMK